MSSVMEEIKGLTNELKSAWEDFKAENDRALEEVRSTHGEETAETKQALERIDAKLDEKIDEISVRLQKLNLDEQRSGDELSPAREAFETLLRQGKLTEEQRAHLTYTDGAGNMLDPRGSMVVSDDTEGGFLAPDDVVDEIIKGVVEFSPMREICHVRRTSRNSVKAPKRTQTTGAVWVGEADPRSETQGLKFGKEEISTRELHAMQDVSRQDLEDAAYDFENELYADWGEQFAVSEGAAFISGDGGDGKPEGILTAADTGYLGANGIETVNSGSNDALTADDLIELFYSLKDSYARNATWVWKRATTKTIRKFKSEDDQYLWQPGLAGLAPATVLDRPYVEAIDMPAIADGAFPVALGDFERGYWIIDRIQIETLRDPYTQGPGFVRFWARKRTGGQVVLPEAIKLLQII